MTQKQITISWHMVTFMIGVIFGAGVLFATVNNMKASSYSREDGKVLELKIEELNQKTDAIINYLQSGRWPIKYTTKPRR